MARLFLSLAFVAAVLGHAIALPKAEEDTSSWDSLAKGCGASGKYCLGVPSGCESNPTSCKAFVSAQVVDSVLTFRMRTDPTNKYVAVGLGETAQMFDTSVVECVKESDDKIHTYLSYTPAEKRGCLRVDSNNGIELKKWLSNNMFFCEVTRQTKTTVNGKAFNLDETKYFLQLATGTAMKDNPIGIGYHNADKNVASASALLVDTSASGARSLTVPGALVVLAWALAAASRPLGF